MVFGLEMKSNRGKMIGWCLIVSILTALLMAFFP